MRRPLSAGTRVATQTRLFNAQLATDVIMNNGQRLPDFPCYFRSTT